MLLCTHLLPIVLRSWSLLFWSPPVCTGRTRATSNAAPELVGGRCDFLLAWPRFLVPRGSSAQPVRPIASFRSKTRRRAREAESPTEDGADYPVDATKQGRTTQQRGGRTLALGKEWKCASATKLAIVGIGVIDGRTHSFNWNVHPQ